MSENSLSCYIIVSTLVCWYSDVHAREKSVCPAQRHYYDVKTSFVQRLSSEFNLFFFFFKSYETVAGSINTSVGLNTKFK